MSVIVGLRTSNGETWIGSDTLACADAMKITVGPKWVVRAPWAVGVAGHLRTMNVVDAHADKLLHDLASAYEFSDRLRDLLKSDGFHENGEAQGPLVFGQTTMLAHPTGLWALGGDFSLVRIADNELWAEGSGRELALGAGYAAQVTCMKQAPEETVRLAIAAAIHFDVGSGGEIWIHRLKAESAPS